MSPPLRLGLTGPFGSGCTTIAKLVLVKSPHNFKRFSLSDFVKQEWERSNPGKKADEDAKRSELQNCGDMLREKNGDAFLAAKSSEEAEKKAGPEGPLVFDSIRNIAEAEFFRAKYHEFFLVGVCCSESDRWNRVQPHYDKFGLKYPDFSRDDERDQNEEGIPFGQQVSLCMHDADLLITNDNQVMIDNDTLIAHALSKKLDNYIEIFKGKPRSPTEPESYMSMAYDASLMSRCIKRQVGAVLVGQRGNVVSIGWNNNPEPLKSCPEEFGDCYRMMRIDEQLAQYRICLFCAHQFQETLKYPYKCPKCGTDIYRMVIRDRAMSKCTALHAEETALLNSAGRTLEDCTLYTTTFPCFTCAQKIVFAGIKKIVYVESYPDLDSIKLFDKVKDIIGLKLMKFEGIKARAYHRAFGPWRKRMEDEATMKRSSSVQSIASPKESEHDTR